MLKLVLVFFGIVLTTNALKLTDIGYDTCKLDGITNLRSFSLSDRVVSCFQEGPNILYNSPWLKVSSHIHMNESTSTVDWNSTKIFIEFYGDIYGLPVAVFTSDILLCDCTVDCLEKQMPLQVIPIGVRGLVDMIVQRDNESTVAYLYHRSANISLYIRRITEGFNFGIRVPSDLVEGTSGLCVSGCPRVSNSDKFKCFTEDYLKPAIDICQRALVDLQTFFGMEDFNAMRVVPCARDLFIWKSSRVALDHRYSLIDEILIRDFDSIFNYYFDLTRNVIDIGSILDDSRIIQMVQKCLKDALNRLSVKKLKTISKMQPVLSGSADLLKSNFIDVSKPSIPNTIETILPLTTTTTTTIPMISTTVLLNNAPIELSTEWTAKCEAERKKTTGTSFHLRYPLNDTMFVQCDGLNRAFLLSCPAGLVFSPTAMTCLKHEFPIVPEIVAHTDVVVSLPTTTMAPMTPLQVLLSQPTVNRDRLDLIRQRV